MIKEILFIALIFAVSSCGKKDTSSNHSDSESLVDTVGLSNDVYSDVSNCFKQWNADNPKRPDIDDREITAEPGPDYQRAYKEYIKNNFGKEHSRTAVVRMYRECPRAPYDGTPLNAPEITSMRIEIGEYIVYSIWRGPVIAQSLDTGNWFVVWDEDYHYNTKYISSAGNKIIKMEYIDCPDIDDNCDVIYYELDTHKYYFVKEKYSGNQF